MRYLLRALCFLFALLIYVVPGLVFCGYLLIDMSHYPREYNNPSGIDSVLTLLVFAGIVLVTPVLILRYATAWINPMIPAGLIIYFAVAYGCLIFFYLRKSKSGHATTNLDDQSSVTKTVS